MAIKKFTIENKVSETEYDQLYPKTSVDQVEGLGASAQEDVVSIEHGGTGATSVAGARNALGLGNTSGAVPVANGGTGSTTISGARTNLGLGSVATEDVVPISKGGTGATSASAARSNLQAMGTAGGTFTGSVAFNGNITLNRVIILSSYDYGNSLPPASINGRLFFKKV